MNVDIALASSLIDDVVGMASLAEDVVREKVEVGFLLSDDVGAPPNTERASSKAPVKSEAMPLLSSCAWVEKTRMDRRGMMEM